MNTRVSVKMKHFFLVVGTLAIILSAGATGETQVPGELPMRIKGPELVPNRYIIQLKENTDSVREAGRLAQAHGLRVLSVYSHALKGFAAVVPMHRVELLRQDPTVLTVEPDRVVHAVSQALPTGVDRIGADLNSVAAIDGAPTNVNVDIAVIDTGVDLDHPDLNVYRYTDCVDEDLLGWLFGITCIDDNDPLNDGTLGNDLHGHGSHVAGIAAGIDNGIGIVGVAPGARIWSVAVLDQGGSGYLYWVVNGIDWVASHAGEIDVANMSLAWQGNSPAARTAIQNAVNAGVVFVVAASNEGQDIFGPDLTFGTGDDWEPAAYPEVAAISALADSDGQEGGNGPATVWGPDDTLATFSNYSTSVAPGNPVVSAGAGIDLAAPGVDIFSTYKDGGYTTFSGTSMASPHVAGAIALYIAANGRAFTAADVAFIRQQVINAGQLQTAWGPGNTADPDTNHEDLVYVADSGSPPPSTPPTAPSNLVATPISSSSIDLSWADNSNNETAFRVDRCTAAGCIDFAEIAQVGADVNVYSDTGLLADTTYSYRVQALGDGGNSDYSNTAQATTQPAVVHDVAVTGVSAPSPVFVGDPQTVLVGVANQGTQEETFSVGLSDSLGASIGPPQNMTLGAGASTTLNFSWTPNEPGQHALTATASTVAGESDTADNTGSALSEVTEPAPSPSITLSVTGTKVRGTKTAELSWAGATSTNVDVYRDGALIATTANDGAYSDLIGKGGGSSFTYQVCEAGTSTCSALQTLTF